MPAKRSSSGSALSWIFAVILISVAAVGVGWLIGQQVLGWINPNRSSVSEQGSEDTGGYSYYPWSGSDGSSSDTQQPPTTTTPDINLPVSTLPGSSTAEAPTYGVDSPSNSSSSTDGVGTTQGVVSSSVAKQFYRVRVGSFGTREAAMAAASELEAQGYPIFVTGGGPWSVQVGAFALRENAIALGDTLANQGYDVTIVE
jgi:cell division septation protein DedD